MSDTPIIPENTPNGAPDYDELLRQFSANGDGSPHGTTLDDHGPWEDTPPDDQDAGAGTAGDAANVFDGWTPVSVAEYADRPLPARRYVIDGLLTRHGVAVFHGAPGSLKTQLMLDAASCVACGQEWLPQLNDRGGYTFPTTATPVVWLNFDMADEDIHERAAAVYRTRPLPDGCVFDVVSLPAPWLSLSNSAMAQQLAEWVKRRGYGLVVIDNFSNVKGAAKLIDESIADVMLNIRQLSKLAECAVWVIHHETKNTAGKSPFERMYGGMHIAASVEAGFSITRSGDTVTLNASKQRGHMTATTFSALHTYMQKEDSTLDTFRFFAAPSPAQQENTDEVGAAPLQQDVLRYLNSSTLVYQTVDEIAAALGDSSANSIRNALNKLVKRERIVTKTVGRTVTYRAVSSPAHEESDGE